MGSEPFRHNRQGHGRARSLPRLGLQPRDGLLRIRELELQLDDLPLAEW